MSQLRREHMIGILFFVVGAINLAGGDLLSALVWGLLGTSSFLYQSPPGEPVRGLRQMDWTPRNTAAVAAVLVALVIVIAQLVTAIAG